MKKEIKWLIIGIIIMLIGILLFFQIKKSNRVENTFTFNSSISVINNTELNFDKYTKIILDKIFKLDSITVLFFMMPQEFNVPNLDIYGFILKAPMKNTYSIYVSKSLKKYKIKEFLSHELIHLKQMHSGRLYRVDSITIIWEIQDTINLKELYYFKRPNEIEAFKLENNIKKELENLLFTN